MKKTLLIILAVLMMICTASCYEKSASARKKDTVSVSDVLEEKTGSEDDVADGTGVTGEGTAVNKIPVKKSGNADVDLTALSSTMVYGEVYDMMVSPEDYVGKTIKMGGECYIFKDDSTGNVYYSCIIQDATACCSQGIEFILDDGYDMPGDYPEKGDYVVIEGVFDTYYEGEQQYCTLRDAEWLN
ncbi:MAG: hypothetical protein IKI74_07115 [Christensenellaceae bacterium]|nr:hypothetical protein [Christensenellaceae bacterium]